jgi:tetratricopeptide (TPR) repeat protein
LDDHHRLLADFPPSRKSWYEFVWRRRRALDALAAALPLAALGAFGGGAPPAAWLTLAGLSGIFLVSWLALPAFLHPFFQRWAWRSARLARWLYDAPTETVWLRRLFGTALCAGLLYGSWRAKPEGIEGWAQLGALGIAGAVIWLVWTSRSRLFIDDFKDLSTKAEGPGFGTVLATQLRSELAAIARVYDQIDEVVPRQIVDRGDPSLRVGVQDKAADLAQAVGKDFKIEAFGISISLGGLLSLSNALWRGPRLQGSLLYLDQQWVLTAQVTGGKREGQWRVTLADPTGEQDTAKESGWTGLVRDLAYHVLAGTRNVGSPRWEAVKAFTDGLRAYRQTRHCKQNLHLHLRSAERAFLQALGLDRNFRQCHFNLGVLYDELDQPESAKASFRRAIEVDPTHFDAHRALAKIFHGLKIWRNACHSTDDALALRAGEPDVWNLRGFVLAAAEDEKKTEVDPRVDQSFALASALAWRRLGWKILVRGLRSEELAECEELAAKTTSNVAERWMRLPKPQRSIRRSLAWNRQARRLRPEGAYLHLVRGMALAVDGRWLEAKESLYRAFGDGLEPANNTIRWACVAQACQSLQIPADEQDHARRYFLAFLAPPENLVLNAEMEMDHATDDRELRGAYVGYFAMVAQVRKELTWLGEATAGGEVFAWALGMLQGLNRVEFRGLEPIMPPSETDAEWLTALIGIRDARIGLTASKIGDPNIAAEQESCAGAKQAVSSIRRALAKLTASDRHHPQIARQGLHSLLARALIRQAGRSRNDRLLAEALSEAEISVRQQPLSASRRWILAEVFAALRDVRQSQQQRDLALELETAPELLGHPETLDRLAQDWSYRLSLLPEGLERKSGLRDALDYFARLLELIECAPGKERLDAAHATLHYWSGSFRQQLGSDAEAARQLEIARALGFRPIATRLVLGRVYAELGLLERARHLFREAALRAHREDCPSRTRRPRAEEERATFSWSRWIYREPRPLRELLTEALLLLVATYLQEGTPRALRPKVAERCRASIAGRPDLQALAVELEGRRHLLLGDYEAAASQLKKALGLRTTSEGWRLLAEAHAGLANAGSDRAHHELQARQALDRARLLAIPPTAEAKVA